MIMGVGAGQATACLTNISEKINLKISPFKHSSH